MLLRVASLRIVALPHRVTYPASADQFATAYGRQISSSSLRGNVIHKIVKDGVNNIESMSTQKTTEPQKKVGKLRPQSESNQAINALETKKFGHIYAKLPFKYHCQEGRVYMWCSCGWSRNQPFCDGTHHNRKLRISNKPIRWECTETKDYLFCQCKQTKTRPICDSSHTEIES